MRRASLVLCSLVLALAAPAGAHAITPPVVEDSDSGGGATCNASAAGLIAVVNGPTFKGVPVPYVCALIGSGWFQWSPSYSSWFWNWWGQGDWSTSDRYAFIPY